MSSPKKNKNGLLEMEQRFADHYLLCNFNGTEAAKKAGYSAKTAASKASQLLKKVNIQKYLAGKMEKAAEKLDISIERTLNEIARVAYQNPKKFYNEDGTFKKIHEMDDDTAAVIGSIETEEVYTDQGTKKAKLTAQVLKFKPWDKMKGLEMLAKHLKIYSDAPPPSPINIHTKKIVYS